MRTDSCIRKERMLKIAEKGCLPVFGRFTFYGRAWRELVKRKPMKPMMTSST